MYKGVPEELFDSYKGEKYVSWLQKVMSTDGLNRALIEP
jgi:hypothetical protein